MQNETTDRIVEDLIDGTFSFTQMINRQLETIRLQHRAEKYQHKEDRAGIAYIKKRVKKADVVFDIGAHKAGYLYFFLEQLKGTGKIYAFEPQSVLHAYLVKLKQLFNWENVTVEHLAVSLLNGEAILSIPYNNGRRSSPCATIIDHPFFSSYQSHEPVTTISLDEYCLPNGIIPDFLKVDVEGNELSVFMGAETILRRYRPAILFECEERFVGKEKVMETFRFLQNIGYKGFFIMGKCIYPIEQFLIEYHQAIAGDCYCNNFIFE